VKPIHRAAALCAVALLTVCLVVACSEKPEPPPPPVTGPPPDSFRVAFETTKGKFVVEAYRRWAPTGVDRFHELVIANALDEGPFFRVVPKFIVQFGAVADPKVNALWDSRPIADDPRFAKNLRGTVAFAQKSAPNTRSNQLFVNYADNEHLDAMGFSPIGRVVEGMAVVDAINAEYRERPDFHFISTLGNSYLQRMFPRLDYIKTARIVP
jgi:peptidyl-prolyl cis-trans isomerase A (cyclophilin A)